MGLPLFKERRLSVRKRLTGLLPGRMQDEFGHHITCRLVDVSQHGLGIISTHFMQPETIVHLFVDGEALNLKVVWKQPDFRKRDLFRYGFVAEDQSVDLEQVFIAAGCLK